MPLTFARSIETQTFEVRQNLFMIVRYPEGKGPNLQQTKNSVSRRKGKQMLTIEEARFLLGDSESRAAFGNYMLDREWGYLLDPQAEAIGLASIMRRDEIITRPYSTATEADAARNCSGAIILYQPPVPEPAKIVEMSADDFERLVKKFKDEGIDPAKGLRDFALGLFRE